jgi:hypothetical protein
MIVNKHKIRLNDLDLVILNHLLNRELKDYPSKYAMKNGLINEYRRWLMDARLHLSRRWK